MTLEGELLVANDHCVVLQARSSCGKGRSTGMFFPTHHIFTVSQGMSASLLVLVVFL